MMMLLSDEFLLKILRLALNLLNRFLLEPSSSSRGSSNSQASPQPGKRSNVDDGHGDNNDDDVSSLASTLRRAYAYFETTETTLTRDQLRKAFKTLSLIHHPDRNANSLESVQEMQMINHFYNLLQESLDRREEVDAKSRTSATTDESSIFHQEQPEYNHSCSSKGQQKERRRQKHEAQERQRLEVEREMRREWEDSRRRMQDFQSQRNKLRRKNRRLSMYENLDTAWGRDKAHQLYMLAVQTYQEYLTRRRKQQQEPDGKGSPQFERPILSPNGSEDLHDVCDDHDDHGNNNSVSSIRGIDLNGPLPVTNQTSSTWPLHHPKPTNPLMECCSENAVVAMRLGMTDVAVEIVHEEMVIATEQWLSFKLREPNANIHSENHGLSITLDDRYYRHILRTLMRPLDEERNSILHYAVYLEEEGMILYLVHVARRYHRFPDLMMYKNVHGLTASDYGGSCSKESSLPGLIASLMQEARDALEEQTIGKVSLRMIQESLLQRPSFFPLFRTLTCLAVGKFVFRSNWVVSSILTVLATCHEINGVESRHRRENRISFGTYFLTIHLCWFLTRTVCVHGWKVILSLMDALPLPWEIQAVGVFSFAFTVKMRYVTKLVNLLSDGIVLTQHFLTHLLEYLLGMIGW